MGGGGSVQSGRGKEINWALFSESECSPATRSTAEREVCAEQIQLPPEPRGFSVWLEGSEVTWIRTLRITQHQVLLCIGQETEA